MRRFQYDESDRFSFYGFSDKPLFEFRGLENSNLIDESHPDYSLSLTVPKTRSIRHYNKKCDSNGKVIGIKSSEERARDREIKNREKFDSIIKEHMEMVRCVEENRINHIGKRKTLRQLLGLDPYIEPNTDMVEMKLNTRLEPANVLKRLLKRRKMSRKFEKSLDMSLNKAAKNRHLSEIAKKELLFYDSGVDMKINNVPEGAVGIDIHEPRNYRSNRKIATGPKETSNNNSHALDIHTANGDGIYKSLKKHHFSSKKYNETTPLITTETVFIPRHKSKYKSMPFDGGINAIFPKVKNTEKSNKIKESIEPPIRRLLLSNDEKRRVRSTKELTENPTKGSTQKTKRSRTFDLNKGRYRAVYKKKRAGSSRKTVFNIKRSRYSHRSSEKEKKNEDSTQTASKFPRNNILNADLIAMPYGPNYKGKIKTYHLFEKAEDSNITRNDFDRSVDGSDRIKKKKIEERFIIDKVEQKKKNIICFEPEMGSNGIIKKDNCVNGDKKETAKITKKSIRRVKFEDETEAYKFSGKEMDTSDMVKNSKSSFSHKEQYEGNEADYLKYINKGKRRAEPQIGKFVFSNRGVYFKNTSQIPENFIDSTPNKFIEQAPKSTLKRRMSRSSDSILPRD
ncbi:hypothetical protein AYI68_g2653 [Smittium mucronatum]|uniref:Uncharacterized protein n=1 Tax=Smittium mucronatum TaxID=133383 RepID=A0A1R0H243_9FUNG|nr:hypothetical protein AYI68_g2653 [Smittium mucronatum]